MSLVATVRGIPQLYYGSEIGMKGDKNVGDGDIRHDFPGGWKDDSKNAFSAEGRTKEQQQFFDITSKLFNWRKGKSVIHNGKTTHYVPENNIYTYFRHNDAESVMVIINNSDEKQEVNVSRFKENTQHYSTGKDVISGQSINIKNNITIEAKSALILELK